MSLDARLGNDLAHAHRVALDRHHHRMQRNGEPELRRIRRRLVAAGAFDALAALDRLSEDERFLLIEREQTSC